MRITEVERIGEQGGIVGAHIEHHRQAMLGRDARAGRVERELADGDAHAVHAQIAQAQDPLPIGDHDHVDVLFGPVAEHARRCAHDPPA